jgi:SAM-dependent methyltransferase
MSEATLYDEVPYPGRAFPQTHPDRLATMATLFGVDTAPPDACRVLELGCGDGGNLLPMALALPASQFVGIDLSSAAIGRAEAIASQLEMPNVAFEEIGLEAFSCAPGSFDYVIAHGVYSWVPEPVRERLLAVCAHALSPRGVAYVSYNAMPGHRTRQTLRELLAFALEGIDDPRERMATGRALLADASVIWPHGEGLETTLGGQARMLLEQGDALFFHDTLSPINKALYFREFVADAARHGLQFLSEAEFTEMQTAALPERLRQRLDAIDDVVEREQLVDFLKQRMFRQTLLCHADVAVDGAPRAQRLATLFAAGPIEWVADEATGRVGFSGSGGGAGGSGLSTDHPLLIAALQRIGAAWPGAVSVADLADGDPDALAIVCEALLPCFAANLVRLHAHPPALSIVPGARPRVSPLARLQARDRESMTTLRHTSIGLDDDLGWVLVARLDGTRDRAQLLIDLETVLQDDYPDLEGDLERSLATLARVGMLLPDA